MPVTLQQLSVCRESSPPLAQVARLLDEILSIDIDELELLVQEAHECSTKQVDDPPEPFPVTRQALRMFWHFRCNIESVEVMTTDA